LETGHAFEGKYEVLEKLREGGMGAIYKVRHRLLDQVRVVKVMRPSVAASPDMHSRFLREAQLATRLSHPNIVTFHDFAFDSTETAYMVMEYIEGTSLADLLKTAGRLPLSLVVRVGTEALAALGYLHRRRIVHRDLSPDNVMLAVDEDGSVRTKLIDLGIAKPILEAHERLTATGEFIGKLRYASPEQIELGGSEGLDGRSDLYSLGASLYELATGLSPFRADGIGALLRAHAAGAFLPFEESDPEGRLGGPLRDVLRRSLAPSRDDRYGDADAFSAALQAAHAAQEDPDEAPPWTGYLARGLAAQRRVARAGGGSSAQRAIDSRFPATRPRPTDLTEKERTPVPETRRETAASLPARDATRTQPEAVPLREDDGPDDRTDLVTPTPRPAPAPARDGSARSDRTELHGADVVRALPRARAQGTRRRVLSLAVLLAGFAGAAALVVLLVSPSEDGERPTALPVGPVPEGTGLPALAPALPSPAVGETPHAGGDVTEPSPAPTAAATAPPATVPAPAVLPTATPVSLPATVPSRSAVVALPTSLPRKLRYCPVVEPTSYAQGSVREEAAGFSGAAYVAPRPDAGRIQIQIEVDPPEPREGEPAEVVARIVNDGDMPLSIRQVEELRARGGFVPLAAARVPLGVDVGGVLEIYRTRFVLAPGATFLKDLRVVDESGDVWRAGVRIVPCP